MENEQKHTPGKWEYWTGTECCSIVSADSVIAHTAADGTIGAGEANAQRIVACVNACEGVSDHLLPLINWPDIQAKVNALRAENERLREALRAYQDAVKGGGISMADLWAIAEQKARAALAGGGK